MCRARRRKRCQLGISTTEASRLRACRPDQVSALDFQFDTTSDGRILKLLHVVDEHTREALAVQVERRINAAHTVRVLNLKSIRRRQWGSIDCRVKLSPT